jgi:hypothetical protein
VSDRATQLFAIEHEGYLQLHADAGARSGERAGLLSEPVKFPAIVPGPAADVSVGIAIAHFKSPLQDVVRAAQTAEKRAKRAEADGGHGRGAVAISIYKRSGEILEWGCRWSERLKNESTQQEFPGPGETAAFRLLKMLVEELGKAGSLNARFPHKLEALLKPYLPQSASIAVCEDFEGNFAEVLALELHHCLERNEGGKLDPEQRTLFSEYWNELGEIAFSDRLNRLINLLRVAAWMRGESARPKPDASAPATATQPA